uniref:ZT_dimer domain-containing protein n=1 Tax=Panagrellus redivivus TaxID=6233 RepID=A0A7E4ZV08_PANRE
MGAADDERKPLLESVKCTTPPVATKTGKNKRLPGDQLSKKERSKLLKQFYDDQDDLKKCFELDLKSLDDENRQAHINEYTAASEQKAKSDKILAAVIFVVNVVLLLTNLTASILSGSYSVISAFIDSSMDITSGFIIYVSLWAISNTNRFNYPRGRNRLEVIAVIISSVIMAITNIMMILTSVQAIVADNVDPDLNLPTILLLSTGISSKIILMIACYKNGTTISKLLALDQRNDAITNVVAFVGAFVGDHYWKYADPIGAILVCTFIATSWFSNAFEHLPILTGRRAEKEHIGRILNIALTHDDRIKFLDHILVYHIGEKELVELHIVLDENLPLRTTHDIAETLEFKIRGLEFVERVFVHVDYRCDGREDGC